MLKIGVLQGVLSENKNFPYATWKSEFIKINDYEIDFLDWIIDAEPTTTFYNFIFDKQFRKKIIKNNLTKEIRGIYCKCFEEYNLLDCDSSIQLYKRISVLEKIILSAKKSQILQITIPVFTNEPEIKQKQIDNLVFIIRMALKNVEQKKQKIVIETNLQVPEILEIFRKVDSKNVFLSLTMSYLNKLKNKDWEKIKKYIPNLTIDEIIVTPDPDKNQMKINFEYTITQDAFVESDSIEIIL